MEHSCREVLVNFVASEAIRVPMFRHQLTSVSGVRVARNDTETVMKSLESSANLLGVSVHADVACFKSRHVHCSDVGERARAV